MRSLRRFLPKLALCAGSALGTLVLGEVGARLWLEHYASREQFLRYATTFQYLDRYGQEERRHEPHWYLGYRATPDFSKQSRRGLNRHNSLGFRGLEIEQPKPEGRFRIACLGGSTTYTTDVLDHRYSYPALLQKELVARTGADLDVVNAGLAGWTSWETLFNFELRVLDLDPDLIIVYHAVNDIHARMVWPPEAYRPDNSGTHRALRTAVYTPPIYEYSTLLRITLIAAGISKPHKDRLTQLRDPAPTGQAALFNRQYREGTYPQGIFREVGVEEMLAKNPPIYFQRNIENLVAMAQRRDIEVVLATFAHSPRFEKVPWSSSAVHAASYVEMNDLTRSIATAMGARLFDFATLFPEDERHYSDGIHVNRSGAELKARMFADYLLANGLIPGERQR